MPKLIDYPRASFKNSLKLAKAVSELGGKCNKEICADHMKRKLGGAYTDLISAANKFGLIKFSEGNLVLTQLYKDYKNSYDESERIENLRKSFFNIPLFKEVYDTYKDKKLVTKIFDKILIREFDVVKKDASKVKGYFIEAAKLVKLLNPDDSFNELNQGNKPEDNEEDVEQTTEIIQQQTMQPKSTLISNSGNYVIDISGPAINQTIEIVEEDHLTLVEAALGIIKRKLLKREEDETD